MSDGITGKLDSPITWRSLARIGLGFAGEYALLALIEDAPATLKIATVLCAIAGLFVLESEAWLEKRRRHAFGSAVVILMAIYMNFVWYAVNRVLDDRQKVATLQTFYLEGNQLLNRTLKPDSATFYAFDTTELNQWRDDAKAWENKTSDWLEKNMGSTARTKFEDRSGMPGFCWAPKGVTGACDMRAIFMNYVSIENKNISQILEQMATYNGR